MSICELLPWFAADGLDESDRMLVVLHLGTCGTCRQELAFWHSIGPKLHAEIDSLPIAGLCTRPLPDQADDALTHRLLREILQLVPVSVPRVTICMAEFALPPLFDGFPVVKVPVPTLRNQSLADWLLAAVGN